jgi:hypothetical protein
MRRRTFLLSSAAAMAGLAGCSTGGDETPTLTPPEVPGGGNSTETPVDGPTDTPHEDPGMSLGEASVADLETGPRTLALSPTGYRGPDGAKVAIEVVATATADSPARLRATLANGNDWPNTFRLDDLPPFRPVNFARVSGVSPGDRETGLYLAPTANHDLLDADPAYGRGPEGYWATEDVPPKLPETVELDPAKSVTGEYLLLGDPEREGFPTGRYRFDGRETGFTITVWNTDRPGPDADSRFAGRDVPGLPGSETAWFHGADASTPVFVRPSTEQVSAPGRVEFTLVNHGRDPLGGNPYDWTLYKLVDGEWLHVAPWAIPVPYGRISPGGTFEYALRAFNGQAVPCDDAKSVGHLGGGTYAFETGFSRETEDEKVTTPVPAAMFDLDAPPVEPRPDDDVTVERDGDTVTVTTPKWDDGDHPPNERIEVVPSDRGGRRIIPEQLFRRPYGVLRNVVPFFEDGVERVVLRTDAHALWSVEHQSEHRYFTYDGQSYEARPVT